MYDNIYCVMQNINIEDKIDECFSKLGKDGWYSVSDIERKLNYKKKKKASSEEIEKYLNENPEKYQKRKMQQIEKYKVIKLNTLVLVGNSPNLIERYNAGAEWDRLLKDLEAHFKIYLENVEGLTSFSQRMQAICNLYYSFVNTGDEDAVEQLKNQLKKWFEKVAALPSTAVHKMLAEFNFDHYLTTNYDLALDRALAPVKEITSYDIEAFLGCQGNNNKKQNIQLKDGKNVTHIHGSVYELGSVVMTTANYAEAIEALLETQKTNIYKISWLKAFCESEVHICGLNLRSEESVIWYALKRRRDYLLSKDRKFLSSYPRAYVYLFYNEDNQNDYINKLALKDLLTTYAVNTILIAVRNNDYITAWKQLMGEMMLAKYKRQMQQNPEGNDVNEEIEEALCETELGGGTKASIHSNMSTAFVAHYIYPYHCLLTMSAEKKEHIKTSHIWLIYCKINSKRYMYSFPEQGCIKKYLVKKEKKKEGDKKPDNSKFLLNYITGELYYINKNKLKKVGNGCAIGDIRVFKELKYSGRESDIE